jgi:penicillin-binding protein 1C
LPPTLASAHLSALRLLGSRARQQWQGLGCWRRWEWRAALTLLGLLGLDQALPPPIPPEALGVVITARDSTPLRTYPSPDGVWRQPITPEQVSPLYLQALLGYEDRWFAWHPGVNPLALGRAAWQWGRSGRIVSGGSTLTMQVARIIEPPAPGEARQLRTKLCQILRAVQLELRLSKREILTLYLNHAPMGGIVEGVEMASRAYLGKPASTLSPAEAALLAALPQAPSRLRPDRVPQAAQAARDKVLARLAEHGVWTDAVVADARMERVAVQPIRAQWLAPLAAERVRSQALAELRHGSRDPARQPGAQLRTTLDVELQSTVERMLLDRVGSLPPKVSLSALVMDNDTLEVLAYAGSADFSDRSRAAHVDMVRGVRSPGSTLKPFLYALALDEGLVHSESLLVDAPQSFGGYQPGNFQASFSGPVSVSEALQKSLNVPAVDLLDRLGPARFAATLRSGGLRLRMPKGSEPNLSLILGGAGTTLEELVGAYRALARGGVSGQPRLTPQAPRVEARLMSDGAAFIVRDILEGGGHPDRPLSDGVQRLAWKTGTSFGFRDAWALGVTDRYTVGVWVGRPDGTPNPGFFGANTAAPLLKDIVAALPREALGESTANWPSANGNSPQPLKTTAALADARQTRPLPASVSPVTTCWPLGLRVESTAPEHCEVRHTGWALQGTTPPTLPDRQRTDGLLVSGPGCGHGDKAAPGTEPASASAALAPAHARWPAALAPWVAGATELAGCSAGTSGTALRIVGLEPGAVLKAVPGRHAVEISVSAQGQSGPQQPLYWLLDGQALPGAAVHGNAPPPLQITQPGPHSLTALDERGRFARVAFRVDVR